MLRRGLDAGRGSGTVSFQAELHAALRCIPSAHVQPKQLMKSESARRTEYFHKNIALAVIPTLPLPLSSLFYLFVALPSGHSCKDKSGSSSPPLTLVRFTVQQLDDHLTLPG